MNYDRIKPRLAEILRAGEPMNFVTRGRYVMRLSSLFGDLGTSMLNRRAIILTDQRIILLQIGNRLRPERLAEHIPYSAIANIARGRLGRVRLDLGNGEQVTLARVRRADRARLVERIDAARAGMPPESRGRESLCSYCYEPVTGKPPACAHCGGTFKSARTAALLSLVFPGIGDWYLGHHTFAAVEIAAAAVGWMALIGNLWRAYEPLSDWIIPCLIFFAFAHGGDAWVTSRTARRGLYPSVREKPSLGTSLRMFATVIIVFMIAVIGSIVYDVIKEQIAHDTAETTKRFRERGGR